MNEACGDNRFEIIQNAKNKLIEATNIEASPEEMKVLDNILFRMWQMGWLPELPKGRPGSINVKLDEGAYMPERAHELDAGYDLRTPRTVAIYPSNSAVIDTGVHVQIPEGYVGFLKSKSGLNVIWGITGEGVIDAGYTGSIKAKLYNNGYDVKKFEAGDKIIQLVILPIYTPELVQVDELEQTDRGDRGFGSTGRR